MVWIYLVVKYDLNGCEVLIVFIYFLVWIFMCCIVEVWMCLFIGVVLVFVGGWCKGWFMFYVSFLNLKMCDEDDDDID